MKGEDLFIRETNTYREYCRMSSAAVVSGASKVMVNGCNFMGDNSCFVSLLIRGFL